ncbi:hypothetical protein J6590_086184 [Homalodisca vitripennis]|nr:hypothetical protein J6590_086184 [Homalodisca vitripennis]
MRKATADEIEALRSIYGDQWQNEDELAGAYRVEVTEGRCEAALHIKLPPQYPCSAPPQYQLSAPSLTRSEKQSLSAKLENIYLENVGESVIYQWVEALREFLQDRYVSGNNLKFVEKVEDSSSPKLSNNNNLKITHGEPVIDRRSIFQAHAAHITSVEQVKEVLSTLLANKKIGQATHNIYAYRVLHEGCMHEQCDDDGEKAAGGRLLHLLQATGATNVMVVVSRWRGGVNIGPDRFRHINSVARQVLQQLGFVKKK